MLEIKSIVLCFFETYRFSLIVLIRSSSTTVTDAPDIPKWTGPYLEVDWMNLLIWCRPIRFFPFQSSKLVTTHLLVRVATRTHNTAPCGAAVSPNSLPKPLRSRAEPLVPFSPRLLTRKCSFTNKPWPKSSPASRQRKQIGPGMLYFAENNSDGSFIKMDLREFGPQISSCIIAVHPHSESAVLCSVPDTHTDMNIWTETFYHISYDKVLIYKKNYILWRNNVSWF